MENGRGGIEACGRKLSEKEMKELGVLTRRCTNNIHVKVLCKECKIKQDALQREKKQ